MSLYNGSSYLREQMASLAGQLDVDVTIFARDDGSSDDTVRLFREVARSLDLSHQLLEGDNIGAAASFFALIATVPTIFDFYAFADQDDVWLPRKLSRAATDLSTFDAEPALYFCSQVVVNKLLEPVVNMKPFRHVGFGNALIQNVVQGAAAVINRPGLELLRSLGTPKTVYMHDWWFYLVFSTLGELIYDPWHGLLYRQHEVNVIGSATSRWTRWLGRVRRYVVARPTALRAQAEELAKRAGDQLRPDDAALLHDFIEMKHSWRARTRLAFGRRLWRQAWHDGLIWRAMLLVGRV